MEKIDLKVTCDRCGKEVFEDGGDCPRCDMHDTVLDNPNELCEVDTKKLATFLWRECGIPTLQHAVVYAEAISEANVIRFKEEK